MPPHLLAFAIGVLVVLTLLGIRKFFNEQTMMGQLGIIGLFIPVFIVLAIFGGVWLYRHVVIHIQIV
jgi:TM2 domain-containing membrane protein YozV